MGISLPERQKWLEHALQGLAFWIGHRHSLFNGYPLTEGALVAEACNLIQSNLPHNLVLFPECMYKNLVPKGVEIQNVTGQSRADLVLCSSGAKPIGREGNIAQHVEFVLEVKRGSAQAGEINADLERLHNFLIADAHRGVRAFLLVVSESFAPRRFVKDGKSWLGAHEIPGADGHFRVRRTVKAAASFSGKESAHYVCLIEVFLAGQKAKKI
ncbi:hypothetical protein [Thioalkalivibrio sp. ALE11]|uniref:hypothetical protein n=1 Tax=Thioalkalivibrio sp. ALE11 TaxID=1265494 RepID=UPI0012DFB668|nr:hypothetical protein [Thioalkalivibrio sp. ALE11]